MGDPSGRLKEREQLSQEAMERNLAGLMEIITRVFRNDQEVYAREGGKELEEVQ